MKSDELGSKQTIFIRENIFLYVMIFVVMGSLGQIAIHIIVPAIDVIATSLQTSLNTSRHTITIFLAGFAFSLPFCGPLVDRFGRAQVLYVSLFFYIISSLMCMVVSSVNIFFFSRFLQGLSAGAGLVVSRALLRDQFSGASLTKAVAYLNIAMAFIPAFSPLLGGVIFEEYGWRSLFLVTSICGCFSLFISYIYFNNIQNKQSVVLNRASFINLYLSIIKSKEFLLLSLVAAFQHATWWIFLSGMPSVFNKLAFSVLQYGSVLPFVVGTYMLGSMVTASFASKLSKNNLLTISFLIQVISMCVLTLLPLLGYVSAYSIIIPELVNSACVGTTVAMTTAGALQLFPEKAGTAAALNTFLTLIIAAIATGLISFIGASALSVTLLMASSALISLFLYITLLNK